MTRIVPVFLLFASLPLAAAASAEPKAKLPPIKAVQIVKPKGKSTGFKTASREKPLIIRSEQNAAKHFSKEALAKLKKQVDFKRQFVLVFAWRGSGQDRLRYDVGESFPEQIFFRYKPGRTRDLRPHVYVFALRSNVKWTVR